MLVVTPAPHPRESLFGYLIRLSESNGYHTPKVVTSYAGYPRGGVISLNSDLNNISEVTGVALSKLNAIAYTSKKSKSGYYYLLGVLVGDAKNRSNLSRGTHSICPECVHEIGYIEAYWDLTYAIGCPKHGNIGTQVCPTCGDQVNWRRQGLLTCHCGSTLQSSTYNKLKACTRHLLALFHWKIHGYSLQELNKEYFPKQVKNLALIELLHLVYILGKYGTLSKHHRGGEAENICHHLDTAAEALADWPHGLHRYFHRLGNYYLDQFGASQSLRVQFIGFYNALFRNNKYKNTFEFIRTEFLNFGTESFSTTVIHKTMYRNTDTIDSDRYLSMTESASKLQVAKATLKKWCATGQIPCRSMESHSGKRYMIDSQYIAKHKRTKSGLMNDRKAAAFLGISTAVMKLLKASPLYSSNPLTKLTTGYYESDLIAFKERLDDASGCASSKDFDSDIHSTLESVLNSAKWWGTEEKINFLRAYLDGHVKPIGKATMDPLSVYFREEEILEYMGRPYSHNDGKALSRHASSKIISCSNECISELLKQNILSTYYETGHRAVCTHSLKKFDNRYLALSVIARTHPTNAVRLARLSDELQLNTLHIKVPPRGFITSFIERKHKDKLLIALRQ